MKRPGLVLGKKPKIIKIPGLVPGAFRYVLTHHNESFPKR